MTLREFILEASGEKKINENASIRLEKKLGADSDEFYKLVNLADRFAGPGQVRLHKEEEGKDFDDLIKVNLEKFKSKASKIISEEEAKRLGGWEKIFKDMANSL